jgi:hypothetical protein
MGHRLFSIIAFAAVACNGQSTVEASRSALLRYVAAIQQRDYAGFGQLDEDYAAGVAVLRSQIPRALWQEFIADYREKFIKAISIDQPIRGPADDSYLVYLETARINFVTARICFPGSARWEASEVRRQADNSKRVFVIINYPIRDDAPTDGPDKHCKRTVLEFKVTDTPLVKCVREIKEAITFW